jgi:hypothetical protein
VAVSKIEFKFDGSPPRRRVVRGRDVLFEDPYDSEGGGWPFPMPQTTGIIGAGLTYGDLTPSSGDFNTTSVGQVVEGLDITGRFVVNHANVTLRKSRVRHSGNYGIDNRDSHLGLLVEDVEIDGVNTSSTTSVVSGLDFGASTTYRRCYLHNATNGITTYGGSTFEDNYLIVNRATTDGAHREAILGRGSNHTWQRNVLICASSTGCSAAAVLYGFPSAVTNCLIEDNYFAGLCGFCFYAGATHDFPDDTEDIRVLTNAFDRRLGSEGGYKEEDDDPDLCGRAGDITGFDGSGPGNVSSGNYYWPDLLPLGTPEP